MSIEDLLQGFENSLARTGFSGWDPFDGLNSGLLKNNPVYKSKIFRLGWIQFFKRCPVNFRKIALVSKGYNSKSLSLVIRGMVKRFCQGKIKNHLKQALTLAQVILSQRAKDRSYFCAGYPFPWQARAFYTDAYTPNMVVSTFAGQAFLDLFKVTKDEKWLELVMEIGEFIKEELILWESTDQMCFGYIPGEPVIIHNANLLGAALFGRLFSLCGEERYGKYAQKSVAYTVHSQRPDGSWFYGEASHHQWVDNFHTGFNLVAIKNVQDHLSTQKWQTALDAGFRFHVNRHFLPDMTPKYYSHKIYPLDIHNFAQGIITFLVFNRPRPARQLYEKAMDILWNEKGGYFNYQKNRWYTNKINYIRWSQAWMYYALAKMESPPAQDDERT